MHHRSRNRAVRIVTFALFWYRLRKAGSFAMVSLLGRGLNIGRDTNSGQPFGLVFHNGLCGDEVAAPHWKQIE